MPHAAMNESARDVHSELLVPLPFGRRRDESTCTEVHLRQVA